MSETYAELNTPSTSAPATPATPATTGWRGEDWLAVALGVTVIILVLAGLRPQLPVYAWKDTAGLTSKVLSLANLWASVKVGLLYLVLSLVGIVLMGKSALKYLAAFPFVYALSWVAQVIAGNASVNYWGLEYVIFALVLGLLISNTVGVPEWLKEAVRTEYFIKTGLVILGAGILFQEILQAGLLGIVQALLVVTTVWFVCFRLAKWLRVDDEFAVILSSAVSICGVSAAIAASGAIQGDRKKLSYVTSLVLIVAVPMIVLQPWLVRQLHIPEVVGGAWLGGTLDTTGSVVAAGALIGEQAVKAGTIVKLSQNVLIGGAAFLLSLWWTMKKSPAHQDRPSFKVIWERFPKFVIGFIVASLIFSFVLSPALVKETKGLLGGLRTIWFALAFTSIGLETRFADLIGLEGGRPALAFTLAQAFNVIWTLLLAFLLFGGILVAAPQFK
ncbi:MAG TPA: putative sulfate exporter family transporter [Blastocatellia bacterium]|nr:putative sulfate exporter family transporter [Blastocatellia bacterium]